MTAASMPIPRRHPASTPERRKGPQFASPLPRTSRLRNFSLAALG
jgi:hypothetical protein